MQGMQGGFWLPGRNGEAHCLTPRPPNRHIPHPWSKDRIAPDNKGTYEDDQVVWFKCIACSPQGQTSCGSRTCSRCCYPPLGETNTSQLSVPSGRAAFFSSLYLFNYFYVAIDYQRGGFFGVEMLGSSTHRRRLCCVSAGPRIGCRWRTWESKLLFPFFSSLLVVARILRLDLLVREHTTPAP